MSNAVSWSPGGLGVALTKTDMAYANVRDQILTGKLAPGALIDQEALAASLGLSTTPVREALRRLESERLVISRAHRDTVVSTLSSAQLQEVYAIRLLLDPYAAGLAAVNASDVVREELAELLKSHPDGDSIVELHYNRELHSAVYRACGSETLVQMLDQLWDLSDRHRFAMLQKSGGAVSAQMDHVALVQAVIDGHAERATSLMRKHVAKSSKQIR